MTLSRIKSVITKFHFYLLGLVLVNFILKKIIEISLNYNLTNYLVLSIYISGFFLFCLNFKTLKKMFFYYLIYVITPIVFLLFWIFGGIFLAILTSVVLYPIQPDRIEIKNNNFTVYQESKGFLGVSYLYVITEKKIFLEKKIKEIDFFNEVKFDKNSIKKIDGKTVLKIKYEKYQFGEENLKNKDTLILIKE